MRPRLRVPSDGEADATNDTGSLRASASRGVLWMTLQKWFTRIGGFVTVAILTRLLQPSEFGIVAATMTVLPLVVLLSDLGFSTYVVQAVKADQTVLSTSFWYCALAGVVLGGGLALSAPVFARLFAVPQMAVVLPVLAPAVLMVVLRSVPVALLRRRMQFRALAAQSAVAAALAQVIAIVLAVNGAGVWALVAQQLVAEVVTTAAAWWSVRWLPSLHFSRREFSSMARFGSQVVFVDLAATFRGWAEVAIVSHSLGTTALGYLSIARKLVDVTSDLSGAAIPAVSQVVFARMRDSLPRLQAAYQRALSTTYGVVSLPLLVIAVGAPIAVPLIFGGGWDRSVPVASALAVAGVMTLGAVLDQGLFYGLGRPGAWLAYAVGIDALTVLGTAVGVRWGLVGVALAFIVVAAAATATRWVLVARQLRTSTGQVAAPLSRTLPVIAASALTGGAVLALIRSGPAWLLMITLGFFMALAHVATLGLTQRAVFRDLVDGLNLRRLRDRIQHRGHDSLARTSVDPEESVL
jgi:O-antigen/teichoic acid export membrane protein